MKAIQMVKPIKHNLKKKMNSFTIMGEVFLDDFIYDTMRKCDESIMMVCPLFEEKILDNGFCSCRRTFFENCNIY